MKSPFASIPFWIGLFLFSVYLLSFSGKFHVMDELAVFAASNNLAQHGRADINQLIWTNHWTPNPPGLWGADGHLYTKKAPGISFITAPLIWLGHILSDLNAVHVGLLTNSFITALTASLLFIWLLDLGFSRTAATLTTLGYGLCTIAWIYARMFWESSMLALSFLGAVWAIYRATRLAYARQRLYWILLSGLAIAIGLTLRFETGPAIIFIGIYLIWESAIWRISQSTRQIWTHARPGIKVNEVTYYPTPLARGLRILFQAIPWGRLFIYLTPIFFISLGLLFFNFTRYGSFTETGYTPELLFRAPWVGGYGLLFSPGRGLFIYAPFTLLLFFGLRPVWQRLSRPYFWLIAAIGLFYWLFYGAWFAWGGTWGWGPRFLLPILPLLMPFIAAPIEWAQKRRSEEAKRRGGEELPQASRLTRHFSCSTLAWLGIGFLAALSLIVNFLGLAVDFNEHFLRLGSNDNFVFNWRVFPPLAHWRILQEGVVDLIWLRQRPAGLTIDWPVLTPALLLFGLSTFGLAVTLINKKREIKNRPGPYQKSKTFTPPAPRSTSYASRPTSHASRSTFYILLFILLPLTLIYETMVSTARLALENEQAQADMPLLKTITTNAHPGDALLIPMPPFGDVQEISTFIMAYLDQPLPTTAWIESPPRAIQPAEREQVSRTAMTEAGRVWLFERWLTQNGPTNVITARLNQEAFPVYEQWFEKSGKLTLYAVADQTQAPAATPVNIPFQGGVTLLSFTLFDSTLRPNEMVLKLRLTWQAAAVSELAAPGLPPERIIAFVQLLDVEAAQNVAQRDRLLMNLQNVKQSPLLPGQTVQQGYGLSWPDALSPGSYSLVVGLYRASDGRRLSRADGSPDDFVYLIDVKVE